MAATTTVTLASLASAHPPPETDHGINETVFDAFWSGDDDGFLDEATFFERTGERRSPLAVLANGTDIPFDVPPRELEAWNDGEFAEGHRTNASVSLGPADANRSQGAFLRDAYVSVFAIQPSTRALLSETDRPLYVADQGEILAIVDYRVALPQDSLLQEPLPGWEIERHAVEELRLLVDGTLEATAPGSTTARLAFDHLSSYPTRGTDGHRLRVEADISTTVVHREAVCVNQTDNGCAAWENETTRTTETLTVTTHRQVTQYSLRLSGYWTRYPDGDLGLSVFKNHPWLGLDTSGGTVRGAWRFFTARNTTWDWLNYRDGRETLTVHGPIHPLETYAYPIEGGPRVLDSPAVELLATYGVPLSTPDLPESVYLDVPEPTYDASYSLVTRFAGSSVSHPLGGGFPDVTLRGLVRGQDLPLTDRMFTFIPTIESNLTLSVLDYEDGVASVEVRLSEADSGDPIDTSGRLGTLVLDGEHVDTDAEGVVRRSIPVTSGVIRARYEPSPWWLQAPGHLPDEDAVFVGDGAIDVVNAIFQLGVPTALLLFAAYLVDRLTGLPIWPPWRA